MLWKLPVIFIVGVSRDAWELQLKEHPIILKFEIRIGYEMPSEPVDGMDPVAIAKAVEKAVKRARKGDGQHF